MMTPPKLAVVMIGTNDLGYTEACFRNGEEVTEAANGTISRCDRLSHHSVQELGSVTQHQKRPTQALQEPASDLLMRSVRLPVTPSGDTAQL